MGCWEWWGWSGNGRGAVGRRDGCLRVRIGIPGRAPDAMASSMGVPRKEVVRWLVAVVVVEIEVLGNGGNGWKGMCRLCMCPVPLSPGGPSMGKDSVNILWDCKPGDVDFEAEFWFGGSKSERSSMLLVPLRLLRLLRLSEYVHSPLPLPLPLPPSPTGFILDEGRFGLSRSLCLRFRFSQPSLVLTRTLFSIPTRPF
jgi:hypothetical protein